MFTRTFTSSSSSSQPQTPRVNEEYVQVTNGAAETLTLNGKARNGPLVTNILAPAISCGKVINAGTLRTSKPSPKVKAFRRTRSKEKDKVFSGFECMPSMGKPQVNPNQIYHFSCSQQRAAFLVSGAAEVFADAQFTLADWNGASSFQGAFDQYRIVGVEVWLVPRVNVNSSSTNDTGIITSVIDYDDSGTTTQAQMTEYTTYMVGSGMMGHYRSFVPACVVTVDNQEANVEQNRWIDCTFGAVVHRGVKFAISATTTVQDNDLYIRMHIEFRCVR